MIEDHDDIRNLLAQTIGMRGFTVTTAATGLEGIEAVRRDGADLITLDLSLPDLDGLEVCRRVRQFSDAVPLSNLFVSLLNALDVPAASFSDSTGKLDQIFA